MALHQSGRMSTKKRDMQEQKPDPQVSLGGPSKEFLDETVRVWQKYYDRPLTHDDARQIIENVTGYFKLLHEMDRTARTRRDTKVTANPARGDCH